jgi:hypothetical protein
MTDKRKHNSDRRFTKVPEKSSQEQTYAELILSFGSVRDSFVLCDLAPSMDTPLDHSWKETKHISKDFGQRSLSAWSRDVSGRA